MVLLPLRNWATATPKHKYTYPKIIHHKIISIYNIQQSKRVSNSRHLNILFTELLILFPSIFNMLWCSSGQRPWASALYSKPWNMSIWFLLFFLPVSVRDSDLCVPVRSGGPGRPWVDVSERPVRGEHPGVSSRARREEESDSSSRTLDQKTRRTRTPVHLRGTVWNHTVRPLRIKTQLQVRKNKKR